MSNRLFIWIKREEPLEMQWAIQPADGGHFSERGKIEAVAALSTLKTKAEACQVIVIVPGEHARLTSVPVPARQYRKVKKALPLILEDELLSDANDCHFACSDKIKQAKMSVILTAKSHMTRWLSWFERAGILVDHLLPDYLLIPGHDASNTLIGVWWGNHLAIRAEHDVAWTGNPSWIAKLLSLHLKDRVSEDSLEENATCEVVSLDLIVDRDTFQSNHSLFEQFSETMRQHGVQVESHTERDALTVFSEYFDSHQINLLQGEFLQAGDYSHYLTLLKPILATAAGIFAVAWLWQFATLKALEEQLSTQTIAVNQQLRQVLPGVKNVSRPKVLVERELKSLQTRQGQSELFTWLEKSVPGLTKNNQLNAADRYLKQLQYDGNKHELRYDLTAQTLNDLELFKQSLTDAGLSVELKRASKVEDRFEGRIVISTRGEK